MVLSHAHVFVYCAGLTADGTEEVSIVCTNAIACIPLPELLACIRLHEAGSGQAADPSLRIEFGKYTITQDKNGALADGFGLGLGQISLKSFLTDKNSVENSLHISLLSGDPACSHLFWW